MTTTSLKKLLTATNTIPQNELEATFFDLFTAYDIEHITGEQLKRMCDMVGSPYNPLNLSQTRAFLKGHAAAHATLGTVASVTQAWTLITDDTDAYSVEYFPASIELHTTKDVDSDTATAMLELMRKVTAGGIRIIAIILDTDAPVYDTLPSTQTEVYDTLPSTQSETYAKVLAS